MEASLASSPPILASGKRMLFLRRVFRVVSTAEVSVEDEARPHGANDKRKKVEVMGLGFKISSRRQSPGAALAEPLVSPRMLDASKSMVYCRSSFGGVAEMRQD
ncbi:hypothetical protein Rs2_25889 [Raphanus sativus]|nr:hypothetical protein Rs2_25889 [Raphanus sativus]